MNVGKYGLAALIKIASSPFGVLQENEFESIYKILGHFVEFCIAYMCFSMLESSDRPCLFEIPAVIKFLNKD